MLVLRHVARRTTSCCAGSTTSVVARRARTRSSPRRSSLALGFALGALCIRRAHPALLLAHGSSPMRHGTRRVALVGAMARIARCALFLPQSLGGDVDARLHLLRAARWRGDGMGALAATSVGFGLLHLANPGATVAVGVVVVARRGLSRRRLVRHASRSTPRGWRTSRGTGRWRPCFTRAVSGDPFPTPSYRMVMRGRTGLTGGAWGPEGGVGRGGWGWLAGIAVAARSGGAGAVRAPSAVQLETRMSETHRRDRRGADGQRHRARLRAARASTSR